MPDPNDVTGAPSTPEGVQAGSPPAGVTVGASPAQGGAVQTVPFSRFKEVNDKLRGYETKFTALNNMVEGAQAGDPDAVAQFEQAFNVKLTRAEAAALTQAGQPAPTTPQYLTKAELAKELQKERTRLMEEVMMDQEFRDLKREGVQFDEATVLDHMMKTGLTPRKAYRDLNFDTLVKQEAEKIAAAKVAEMQAQTKVNATVGAPLPSSVQTVPGVDDNSAGARAWKAYVKEHGPGSLPPLHSPEFEGMR